ncbi:Protoglobin-domain-containing protein [Syncephalastrum racemosum]|uniref:Protoglobin-domain-containing protein n=1 Tax=Syncephalastrum racemosum TaxID=13706 RepID=A0A1X2HWN4_SYNRA|nr:Protoglobin-domain-containing protein [Syncephalastrum racemosum]
MQHIDSDKLYSDSKYRFDYVAGFMDFGQDDIDAIKAVADKVKPLAPVVVDAVYEKLFKYDVTKKHFLPKNEGFEGKTANSLEELTLDHPQIKFRKDFLSKYLNKLLSGPYDERMLRYLDWVAKIHTDTPEKKSKINVDYIHINALLGYVETTLVGGIHSLNLDKETELKALAAFNKLLWIQNDYFAKYYMRDHSAAQEVASAASGCLSQQWLCPAAAGAAIGGVIAWYLAQRQ